MVCNHQLGILEPFKSNEFQYSPPTGQAKGDLTRIKFLGQKSAKSCSKCNANTTVAHPPQNAQDSHGEQTNADTASHVSKS